MTISDWRFTKNPLTLVRDSKKSSKKRRKTIARLLMGEWVKPIGVKNTESLVAYRGGKGYVDTSDFSTKRMLEIYFLDVGQGDAILVQTPDDRRILIDGGRDGKAHSFLKWKYNLKKTTNKIHFDAIVMTHPDQDHAKGLVPVLSDPQITVASVYHNGIVRFKGDKIGKIKNKQLVELYDDVTEIDKRDLSRDYQRFVAALNLAKQKNSNLTIKHLDQLSKKLPEFDSDDLTIKVLGPLNIGTKSEIKYRYFKDNGVTLNGNSVSLMLEYDRCKVLLCGDMNESAETKFLEYHNGSKLRANVFKANHHGSQDFTSAFLNAIKPWASVVSSGDSPDYGHPRAVLLGSLGRHAPSNMDRPLVFSTEIAATFKEISEKEFAHMNTKSTPLYEKAIQGVIHVRSDGKNLVLGRVFGDSKLANRENPNGYDWEYYQLKL